MPRWHRAAMDLPNACGRQTSRMLLWTVPKLMTCVPHQPSSAPAVSHASSRCGRWLLLEQLVVLHRQRVGEDAKKDLAFMGICHVFSRKGRTRRLQSFCAGFRLQIHAWKIWEMPSAWSGGALLRPPVHSSRLSPVPARRVELRLEGMIPQLLRAWLPNML